jgi:opacity protein-like surface antigen
MRRFMGLIVTAALACGVACAGPVPESIDLSSLDEIAGSSVASDDVPYETIRSGGDPARRFYVTGLLGTSFATLDDPLYGDLGGGGINNNLLTAGGAVGIGFARDNGQLRLEVEGRGRDDLTRQWSPQVFAPLSSQLNVAAKDGWSAMVNGWRDFTVAERVDLYAGGGIGVGGYRYSASGGFGMDGVQVLGIRSAAQETAFAWQAGGGVIYNISERVAFDVGYRFFSIDQADSTYIVSFMGMDAPGQALAQQFTASELLFGLRIYEPFRRWR